MKWCRMWSLLCSAFKYPLSGGRYYVTASQVFSVQSKKNAIICPPISSDDSVTYILLQMDHHTYLLMSILKFLHIKTHIFYLMKLLVQVQATVSLFRHHTEASPFNHYPMISLASLSFSPAFLAFLLSNDNLIWRIINHFTYFVSHCFYCSICRFAPPWDPTATNLSLDRWVQQSLYKLKLLHSC